MAQRELSFIYSRAPRAAGVSEKALDEHKDLIGDLYLTQNYTRDQVITYLEEELRFKISQSQFSKATRRWGFHKQPHGGTSTRQPSNDTASQHATDDPDKSDLSYTTNLVGIADQGLLLTNQPNEHPSIPSSTSPGSNTTTLDPCLVLPCPSTKRPNSERSLNNTVIRRPLHSQLNPDSDGNMTLSSPTSEEITETSLSHQSTKDVQLSAEYLACCYHYTEAFNCYSTISISFEDKMDLDNERRAMMLDMARVAKTRRSCELVRLLLETELEMSNDPLAEKGRTQSFLEEDDMCRMQSFLFHRHLAQIYALQNNGASMQEHLDNARNFTKTFDTHGQAPIDLWTLLFLVQDKTNTGIPGDLLDSLQWDFGSYGLNIEYCLRHCWRKLNPTKPIDEACQGYDTDQRKKTEPTGMSDLALQISSGYLWKRSSILFTFLWKEMQLTHGTYPWVSGHPTISPALILLIVSRIIVKRSCLISKLDDDLPNQEEHQVNIHPANLRLYCDALLGLFHDNRVAPDETKREFATQFVEHHTWSSPLDSKSALASQSQSYPIEALKSVLAARRDNFTGDHLSTILEDWTASSKRSREKRGTSISSDFLHLVLSRPPGRVLPNQRPAESYIQDRQFPPPSYSSGKSSYLTTSLSSHHMHLEALKGNPTMARPLASHSSCSSQRSYSSSLQRFKAAALSLQHQPRPTMPLSDSSDVLVDEHFLEDLQEDEYPDWYPYKRYCNNRTY